MVELSAAVFFPSTAWLEYTLVDDAGHGQISI